MAKSISAALRQVIQKLGAQGLANRRPGRDEIVKDARGLAGDSRNSANRSFGSKARPGKSMADKS